MATGHLMPAGRPAARFAAIVVCLAACLFGAAAAAADAKPPQGDLGNASCLSCHATTRPKIEVPAADGSDKRSLRAVDKAKFGAGVHATMECVACHRDIADSAAPHTRIAGAKKPDCAQCHAERGSAAVAKPETAPERSAARRVVQNIDAYRASTHARPSKDDPARPAAGCNDCHNAHDFEMPPPGSDAAARWRLGIADRCGSCHDAHLEEWAESVHGRKVKQEKDLKAANCVDCHTAHQVGKTRTNAVKLAILASCGNCHDDKYKSYRSTYHGQVATLGFANTAKCYDCHGSHDVRPSSDPQAKTHVDNRLDTCKSCHSGKKDIPLATAGFVSFSPHATTDDFGRYPQIWIANKIMVGLLLGTFGFFWLHTLLWFFREFKERRARGAQPHVRFAGSGDTADAPQRQVRRFSASWRIAHLLFALSLMLLTLSGMSLFYPEAPWARTLINLLGGPQTAGLIHRANAVVFAGVFVAHLVVVVAHIVRQGRRFEVFGPNSLIPGLQDLKDIVAMFRWFLGLGPRPVFDRWTYWEKFDYWAPFWGVTIIGVSGALLWVPHVTAQFLPGWVFNVATIFHGEEAFLAVVFLFTVHFFNNHFRPDKFPLDIVMFTGSVPIDEFRREHPLQYRRLLESGELASHLVSAPSRPAVVASKILGFTLIAAGLTLLTLVGIGFFTATH